MPLRIICRKCGKEACEHHMVCHYCGERITFKQLKEAKESGDRL